MQPELRLLDTAGRECKKKLIILPISLLPSTVKAEIVVHQEPGASAEVTDTMEVTRVVPSTLKKPSKSTKILSTNLPTADPTDGKYSTAF